MADYKIANIKWLRDQGWEISSSYADSMCPTYNEIVNEIPKGSTTVNVNETCIATSKAYTNNQLVCENDIHITIITRKFVTLTLSNGNVIDVEGSGTLTQNIMSPYKNTVVKAEIGTLCTSIGIAAFKECSNLESVSVSSTVSSISPYIFGYCNKLTKVTVDSGNATYDSRNNCNGIITKGTNIMVAGCKTTVIPNNVVKIDEGAFWAIESLLSITIPNSVTATSESSFSRCYNLTAVTMSSNLKVIGQSSFRWCAFTSVTIPNSVTTIEQQAFQQSGLVDIVVPDNVTTINLATYEECTNATAATIHSNVDNIYIRAFSGCSNLTKITVEATYPPTLLTHSEYPSDGINTVFGNTNNCPIYVPCESVNTYKTSWSPYADRITCNSAIATLTLNNGSTVDIEGSGELTSSMIEPYKTTVTKAEIKDTCTSIGNAAFSSCASLTSVTIPNSVTSIGASAFYNCSLTSIEIPSSVTSIGAAAFYYCTSLTSVTISDSVTSIGNYTFEGCTSLTSVTIPNSVTSIGTAAFQNCSSLTSVTIPNSVTYIGESGFTKCTSLTNVTLPNSVTTIGRGVFVGCTSLTSMTFPSSVTNIGAAVLTGCTSLERIIVERVVPPTIESTTFDATNECPIYVPCESVQTYKTSWSPYADRITCNSAIATLTLNNGSTVDIEGSGELTSSMIEPYKTTVTKAEIKDTCTSIGSKAFYYCSSITSVTISNSVTSIGSQAFYYCTGLKSVTIGNSVTSIGGAAFSNCTGLTSVTISDSVTSINGSAFQRCISLTSVTIPNSVTSIGNGAFCNCTSLTSITFPSSVTNIGDGVLTGNSSLEYITVERVVPPTIENDTFDVTNDCPIYVPCESVNTYKNSWSKYANRITCNSTDCSVHNWLDLGTSVGKESGTAAIANYIKKYGDIVWVDKPEWITAITQETGRLPNVVMVKATYEASSVDRRVGRVNFVSQSDGCTFSASLTQVNAVGVTVNWYTSKTEWGEGQFGGYYYTTVSNEKLPFTLSVTPSLGTTPYGISTCSEQQATSSYVHFRDKRGTESYTDYYAGDGKIFCSHTIIMLTTTVSGDTMIIRNGVNVTINGIVYNFTWIDVN